jgi:hypothetical protein
MAGSKVFGTSMMMAVPSSIGLSRVPHLGDATSAIATWMRNTWPEEEDRNARQRGRAGGPSASTVCHAYLSCHCWLMLLLQVLMISCVPFARLPASRHKPLLTFKIWPFL